MNTPTDRVPSRHGQSRRDTLHRRSLTALVSLGAAALLTVSAGPLGATSGSIGGGGQDPQPPATDAPLGKGTTSPTTTPPTTTAPAPAGNGIGRDSVLAQADEVETLQTSVTVNPKDDLDPNVATTIEVVGSGFDPGEPGLYVVFGPHRDTFWETEELFLSAQFLAPGNGLNADGTFSTTLPGIVGSYEAEGQTIDCLAEQCYVITMKAHGNSDRSQDTFTPVNFAGGTTDGGGGGPTIDDVENGGTQGPGGTGGPGGSGGTGGDSLASTGTEPLVPVAGAIALIAIGAAFVVVRRRREHATVPVRR